MHMHQYDPNLYYLDGERVFQALMGIVLLAFLLERALALLFESRLYIDRAQGKSLKELIAFVLAAGVCWYWGFDAVSIIFLREKMTLPGILITAAVVAGGSKASIKLFRDVLGFMSSAEKQRLSVEGQKAPKAGKEG